MKKNLRLFTSESVTEGHPDKLCDQISDTLLDALLAADPSARVAIETMVTTGLVHVAGEVTTSAWIDVPALIRAKILEVGYDSSLKGFDGASCGISVSIGAQSPDIAQGVDHAFDSTDWPLDSQGAGDQGIMFGYATDETESLMPLPITLAHALATRLTDVRKSGITPHLRPDGKTQVTIGYLNDKPTTIETIVISAQHAEDYPQAQLHSFIRFAVIDHVLADYEWLDSSNMKVLINPTGRFVIGGAQGDAGLTGRKIIVDTYGGMARHGGGAFSGKDPSKVDRSAAYAMRWIAKNVVAAKLARRCEVQVAYAIGVARPVGLYVDTFGTSKFDDAILADAILEVFDLRPKAIIRDLDLLNPIYSQTATGGHFGRDIFTWEKTNRTEKLLAAVEKRKN
jgi:S-adenosylmethionine synthetase